MKPPSESLFEDDLQEEIFFRYYGKLAYCHIEAKSLGEGLPEINEASSV